MNKTSKKRIDLHSAKEVKATLDQFKSGVAPFTEFYEFISNIVDYDNEELEKLYIFFKHLKELLKVDDPDNELTLSLSLSHYKIHNKKINNPSLIEANLILIK